MLQKVEESDDSSRKHCVMMEILAKASSRMTTEVFALKPAFCLDCSFCRMLKRARYRPAIQDGKESQSERGSNEATRFWSHVDMFANNLYWESSQIYGETAYPIIQQLHKDAITQHPFMCRFSKKFKLKDYDTEMDMVHLQEYIKMLNSIQAEEMRLSKALM